MVIGGRRFPIEKLMLKDGKLGLIFAIVGPQEPFSGIITVFGEDERGCWQGSPWTLDQPIPADQTWYVRYDMTICAVEEQELHLLPRVR